jgi:hypothetical protein
MALVLKCSKQNLSHQDVVQSLTNKKTPLYGQYYPDKLEFWNILFDNFE